MNNIEPRIYVACLAAYNNGHLHGEWITSSWSGESATKTVRDYIRQHKHDSDRSAIDIPISQPVNSVLVPPIVFAIHNKAYGAAIALIDAGANVNIEVPPNYKNLLFWLVEEKMPRRAFDNDLIKSIALTLLQRGVSPNAADNKSDSLLCWIFKNPASSMNKEFVEFTNTLIISGKADLDQVDNDGNTALILAVKLASTPAESMQSGDSSKHEEQMNNARLNHIRLLVDAGADAFTVNKNGETAVSLATSVIAEYLKPSLETPEMILNRLNAAREKVLTRGYPNSEAGRTKRAEAIQHTANLSLDSASSSFRFICDNLTSISSLPKLKQVLFDMSILVSSLGVGFENEPDRNEMDQAAAHLMKVASKLGSESAKKIVRSFKEVSQYEIRDEEKKQTSASVSSFSFINSHSAANSAASNTAQETKESASATSQENGGLDEDDVNDISNSSNNKPGKKI